MAKIKHAVDEVRDDNYIRCWRDREGINVQIWLGQDKPEGEPDGDWAMPKAFGFTAAIAQAVLQTVTKNA